MMNKRGFTLVELLAVIIILSLLALLTSTAVTKLVKDSKGDLNMTQVELIKSAAQTWGADNLTGLPAAGECSYLTLANLKDYGLLDSNLKDPNTNEKISDDLKIKILTTKNQNSGKLITTYEVNPESVDGCYKQVYNNGEVVYFDVTTGKNCTNYKENNSNGGYNGYINKDDEGNETERLSTQNTCLKFYAFNDDWGKKLNLLLDHDIALANWSDHIEKTALQSLYDGTKDWNTQQYISKDFILDPDDTNNSNLEIGYTKVPIFDDAETPFKARFIETQEIIKIIGANNFFEWDQYDATWQIYFDGAKGTSPTWKTQVANSTNKSDYYWLYDRTRQCVLDGCYINDSYSAGYFTSTYFYYPDLDTHYSWIVHANGMIAVWNQSAGVRPVIEVLKSNLQ